MKLIHLSDLHIGKRVNEISQDNRFPKLYLPTKSRAKLAKIKAPIGGEKSTGRCFCFLYYLKTEHTLCR